jgi:ubiquinone/menaquinone biosynthesis C-methylase UbiE
MTEADRADRLRMQFGDGSERDSAAVWDAFDLLLETDQFLNLGYSPRYLPHAVGSSQRRLAVQLGRRLGHRLGYTAGASLLDVGCGRGGPSLDLARRFGFDVTGVDLVGHNVALARRNASEAGIDAAFLVGSGTRLPIATDSVRACVVVDAAPYIGDKHRLLSELARVLEPGGALALSALLRSETADPATIDRFTDAWDMAPLATLDRYREVLPACGFTARRYEDVTAHSVGRFETWAALYLALAGTPLGTAAERLLSRAGVDLDAVTEQVRATRPALPSLRHYVVTARLPR